MIVKIKKQEVVRICYNHLNNFTDIYSENNQENEIPENVKLTVFCKGTDEEGF